VTEERLTVLDISGWPICRVCGSRYEREDGGAHICRDCLYVSGELPPPHVRLAMWEELKGEESCSGNDE
jgi:hypothetical protein